MIHMTASDYTDSSVYGLDQMLSTRADGPCGCLGAGSRRREGEIVKEGRLGPSRKRDRKNRTAATLGLPQEPSGRRPFR